MSLYDDTLEAVRRILIELARTNALLEVIAGELQKAAEAPAGKVVARHAVPHEVLVLKDPPMEMEKTR